MKDILEILYKAPIFCGKDKKDIEDILGKMNYKVLHAKKNELIFDISKEAKYIGIILSGSVVVQNNLASGKVVNTVHRKIGEGICGTIIFSDEKSYPCDVLAKDKCSVLLISKSDMAELILNDSLINKNIINLMAKSILKLNQKAELLSYSSIKEKIAFSLLSWSEEQKSDKVKVPYSKKMWSEYLNVSRPSLYRELTDLVNNGYIELYGSSIKILDIENLRNIF